MPSPPIVHLNPTPKSLTYLRKSNIRTLLPKALTADVQTVFAYQTGLMCADAAVRETQSACVPLIFVSVGFVAGATGRYPRESRGGVIERRSNEGIPYQARAPLP